MQWPKWFLAAAILCIGMLFLPALIVEIKAATESFGAKPLTVLVFGDMMLDRTVREHLEVSGPEYPFLKVAPLISSYDIVVANAEGVFTQNESVSTFDHSVLRFTFATSTLPILASLGFSLLNQANNHTLDFGQNGLEQSRAAILAAGIDPFGDPLNEDPGPVYKNVRGTLVAFVGYHQFFAPDASSTIAAIAEAHDNGAFTIVYPHWGEEYNLDTTTLQVALAHRFIDAGADTVIGSHPHVVEPIEVYKGHAIFYSLGNFIFDQQWNKAVSTGLAVGITIGLRDVSYKLIPLTIVEAQAIPATSTPQNFMLKR